MTNKDRLLSLLGFAPSDNNSIEGPLLDFGINGSGTYDSSLIIPIKKCAIEIMQLLLTTANTSDSTPGFSESYDRGAVEARIKILKGELDVVDDSLPIIRNKSFMW